MIERNIPPSLVAPYMQKLADRVHDWPHLEPPSIEWPQTIFDVAMADDHIAAVREWSAGVWAEWEGHREAIAKLVRQNGIVAVPAT